jgi:hypothetical protein
MHRRLRWGRRPPLRARSHPALGGSFRTGSIVPQVKASYTDSVWPVALDLPGTWGSQ